MAGDQNDPVVEKTDAAVDESADEAGSNDPQPNAVSDSPDPPDVNRDLGPDEGEGDLQATWWDTDESTDEPDDTELIPEDLSGADWTAFDTGSTSEEETDDQDEQVATEWNEEDDALELDADAWGGLEDERQTLPPGRILVGWREFVSLPQLGLSEVIARFDTGVSESVVHGQVVAVQSGIVHVDVNGSTGEVPGTVNSGGVFLDLQVRIGGVSQTIRSRVVESKADHVVVLGREAMEGYVVVDVAMSFLHRR